MYYYSSLLYNPFKKGPFRLEGLSKKLKKARENKSLTLEQLAKKVDSSKSYIWQIENERKNKPSFDIVVKISKILGITLDYLANEDDTKMPLNQENICFLKKFDELDKDSKEITEQLIDHLIRITGNKND